MAESIVEIRDLVKTFGGVRAVDGLDLEVSAGDVFGLLGPNGAGKTTTLRILAGLLRPTRGSARIFGRDPWCDHAEAASRCGFLIEGPGLHPNLSGRMNLDLFARLKGLPRADRKRAVERALDFAALGPAADRPARTYSTGMKQKTAIALAMLGNPDLVVLDEPTAGLDPASVVRLRDAVSAIRAERSTTVLLSSHHLAEMETLCTRVAIIGGGRRLASGAPDEFLPRDRVRYTLHVGDPAGARKVIDTSKKAEWIEGTAHAVEVSVAPVDAGSMVRALVEEGVEVSLVKPARSALEEAYMRLVPAPEPAKSTEPRP
jgi:ABC-2 type transport system ATP-binding protein